MRLWRRLAVYVLVTAIVEGISFAALYSNEFPNNMSAWGGWAWVIAFNIMVYFLWGNAIGGPEAAARPGSWIYNPLVHVVGGVVGMFVFVTVVGESVDWLGKRIGEMAWRNEPERFKRQLDRAVHDFVEAAYSSKNAQRAVEARIIELYSEHPEQVMRYLSEVLGRTKSTGSPKTATRVEMMIEELKTEHSSSN